MDHMDGIKKLFDKFSIINFWDTDNNKDMNESQEWGRYCKEDWEYYQSIRNSKNSQKVRRYLSGNKGQYYKSKALTSEKARTPIFPLLFHSLIQIHSDYFESAGYYAVFDRRCESKLAVYLNIIVFL